ncbi:beta-lactamase family protein [Chitinophaga niastensis]|uniref:Beta-lactamase family protein n=1 Tax=Chitinophaga niastensis TaxID=536980 RepID=A0A2P8HPG3_CHINA|nr:serine hydrolase [Chitinophaga niastensis]PSL48087.1 beta-lactamase family protein [Chitinophaga niastensis]
MQTQHYPATDNFLDALLKGQKSRLGAVFSDPAAYRLQIIFTRIDRDARQHPHFTDYSYGVSPGTYYYPASTVKLPGAILALEKLYDLQIAGATRNTPMFTAPLPGVNPGVLHDYSAADKVPSVAHYIKKIFLVSDNDAFNRLYEFVGQEHFNRRLWEMGYQQAHIRHRVGLPLHEEANKYTNGIRLQQGKHLLYQQPAIRSNLVFPARQDFAGQAHYNHQGQLERKPMDFSYRNKLPLTHLHDILRSIIFPEAVTKQQRFRLTEDDYQFLYRCMSQYPEESIDPLYDPAHFPQTYAKLLLFGGMGDQQIPANIRIFNKPGWAYGFLTDTAYIVDFANNIEFLLSASIFVNKDGILGDDQQVFDEIGKPFLKTLGEIIYTAEQQRNKKYQPDLSRFKLNYKNTNSHITHY